jgi:hypothetical protein
MLSRVGCVPLSTFRLHGATEDRKGLDRGDAAGLSGAVLAALVFVVMAMGRGVVASWCRGVGREQYEFRDQGLEFGQGAKGAQVRRGPATESVHLITTTQSPPTLVGT